MILQGESYEFGTVFQTVAFFMFVIPRLRPGLLSLRSVLSSRQILLLCWLVAFWLVAFWMLLFGNNGNQPNNKITKQQEKCKVKSVKVKLIAYTQQYHSYYLLIS